MYTKTQTANASHSEAHVRVHGQQPSPQDHRSPPARRCLQHHQPLQHPVGPARGEARVRGGDAAGRRRSLCHVGPHPGQRPEPQDAKHGAHRRQDQLQGLPPSGAAARCNVTRGPGRDCDCARTPTAMMPSHPLGMALATSNGVPLCLPWHTTRPCSPPPHSPAAPHYHYPTCTHPCRTLSPTPSASQASPHHSPMCP